MYVCGITPYDATHLGHANTYVAFDLLNRAWRNAGHEVTYVQNVTDVDDPLLERAEQGARRLGRARRARDRALPPGHDRAAGPPAGPLHRRRRVDPARHRADPAPRGGRLGLSRRGRPLLLRDRRPGVRRRVGLDPREDARDLPRARRRPRPPRQEGPARLRRVARPPRGRAVVGQPVGPRTARLAHRVHRDRPGAPRRRVRRPGRRQRPGLPAPRDVRRARPGRRTRDAVREGLQPRRHGRVRRREDVEVARQPGLRLGAAQQRRRPDGDPAGADAPPLPGRLGVGGRRALDRRRRRSTSGVVRCPSVPVRRRARWWPRSSRRWPTTWTRPRAVAAVDRWVAATLGTDGLADTSDPEAAVQMLAVLDAALGLAL